MANVTITGLPPVVSLDLTAVFPIVQGNVTQKTTLAAIQGVVTSNVANLSANNISVASAISAAAISAPIIMGGNISGNIANTTGGYSNVNVAAYLGNVAVDIIPTANNVQNLGSPTKQFKDLYLSNATLYFNSIPMSVTTANTLQFNGANVVVAANGNSVTQGNIAVSGNIVANNVIGNIAVANVVGLGNIATVNKNGNTSTFLNGNGVWTTAGSNYGNSNVSAYLPTNSSDVSGDDFTASGNVTVGSLGGQVQLLSYTANATTVTFDLMGAFPPPFNAGQTMLVSGIQPGEPTELNGIWPVVSCDGVSVVITCNLQPTLPLGFTTYGQVAVIRAVSATGNVTGAYILGNVSQATGLGNISSVDLNGNVSEVLAGDGTWVAQSTGSTYGDANVSDYLAGGTDTAGFETSGAVTATNFFGVDGSYVQPTLLTPNPSDTNWSFGIDGDGTSDFWLQAQFYGQNQPTRGFRVLESEGNSVVFSVNGSGTVTAPSINVATNGNISQINDDLVVSWNNEELILKSEAGGVDIEADTNFAIRTNYDSGTTDYLSKWIIGSNEIVNITNDSAIVTESGDLNLQAGRDTLSSGSVTITAIDNGVSVNVWTFENSGTLTLPGNTFAVNYANGDPITFTTTWATLEDKNNSNGPTEIALGQEAGNSSQGANAVAIGAGAGSSTQSPDAVAIGAGAGYDTQGQYSVAVGPNAGYQLQSASAVAIGTSAGQTNQGEGAVAIGALAGSLNQGQSSIAIGMLAGENNQPANSIIINASGATLDGTESGFFVAPVRTLANADGNGSMVTYNTTTKELSAGMPVLPSFADLAALATAVPTPVAGTLAYDIGNNKAVCYNGSSWNNLF